MKHNNKCRYLSCVGKLDPFQSGWISFVAHLRECYRYSEKDFILNEIKECISKEQIYQLSLPENSAIFFVFKSFLIEYSFIEKKDATSIQTIIQWITEKLWGNARKEINAGLNIDTEQRNDMSRERVSGYRSIGKHEPKLKCNLEENNGEPISIFAELQTEITESKSININRLKQNAKSANTLEIEKIKMQSKMKTTLHRDLEIMNSSEINKIIHALGSHNLMNKITLQNNIKETIIMFQAKINIANQL